MKRRSGVLILSAVLILICVLSSCVKRSSSPEVPDQCSESWYKAVEQSISSGDGMGHGPDIGSEEWKSVIEFKLGIRGNPDVPDRNSQEWCRYINSLL